MKQECHCPASCTSPLDRYQPLYQATIKGKIETNICWYRKAQKRLKIKLKYKRQLDLDFKSGQLIIIIQQSYCLNESDEAIDF